MGFIRIISPITAAKKKVNEVLERLKRLEAIPAGIQDWDELTPLCRAIQMGDWDTAQEIFSINKHTFTCTLNIYGLRAIHIAIGDPKNVNFLEKLLEQIDAESLPTLVDRGRYNPLHFAATFDNFVAAKMLVEKNPHLLFIENEEKNLPIHIAFNKSEKTTFSYLLQACNKYIGLSRDDGYHNPFEGEHGVRLLDYTISSRFLDVAYDLLNYYPQLASINIQNLKTPLECVAEISDAYPSAERYNFYQRFVYSHMPYQFVDKYKNKDIENQEIDSANLVDSCTKSYVYHVIERIYVKFWKVALLHVPHIKRLQEDKMKHYTSHKILKFICEEVSKLKSGHEHYHDAFITAVINNTPEVIEHIALIFPQSIWSCDDNGYYISQLSIMNRSNYAYNFLAHKVTHFKETHVTLRDKDGNNLLHLAGRLATRDKLNMVTGATLQMQMELQWFQEVRNLIPPMMREEENNEQETPITIFRKQHNTLRKEGEEWMKKTAESCTITVVLIITIVFAAAITVPGGNDDNGKPNFQTNLSFIIFAVSDAISMFTSTTSLLLFLSILTSRYAYEDFLYKLPMRLTLGLVMLFMSVTTMLIAFSATLYIMFSQGKLWILIPIGVLTCLPIASFVTLQLPLLVDLVSSTYGHGIFAKPMSLAIAS
ncbi:hypothetical protein QVD17_17143 [Tagetes erecta]|uniref:PGG domain-containing protein n=1 Tax=Tagetes erecta TaxID=13708 RepID=A0AAD8P159_TARER|nr:hypothetical protein QVD17_17143 [Tagetes erecta]